MMIELLLQNGSDINAKNHRGDTPLHWATFLDNLPAVKTLILKGADLHITGRLNLTPYQFAESEKKLHICRLINLVEGSNSIET